jgi:hypothetical protein
MLKNYIETSDGVIKQVENFGEKKIYNTEYISNSYDKYGEKITNMSHLRLGFLLAVINEPINTILDIGYGNGDFLKLCSTFFPKTYGHDVSGYSLPEGCEFVDDILSRKFDVVCFFDSLEHFEEIEFVSKIDTKYVFISLPWCHNHSDEWFENWKHRRPNEHLYHFNDKSLKTFMKRMGYECMIISNFEDVIRKSKNKEYNILSGIFKKI